jgi:hypothetical protein
MSKKTVAIVGSHPKTKLDAPYDRKYVDIWVFNEEARQPWVKRCAGVFQMHAPAVWKNPYNLNDAKHYEWLQEDHPYPVYMMDVYPDVPASVKYPLDEICRELLPGLQRGRQNGQSIRYFTSSVAYAIALAIYRGYERIEIYGVEMETNTEYAYQREGVTFWLGVAVGRGIEVVLHEDSGLMVGLLYGYDGDVELREGEFVHRVTILEPLRDRAQQAFDKINREQAKVLRRIAKSNNGKIETLTKQYFATIAKQAQAAIDLGALSGAIEENQRYLKKARAMVDASGGEKHIFARQEFERMAAHAQDQVNVSQAKMQNIAGQAIVLWKASQSSNETGDIEQATLEIEKYALAHQEYIRNAYDHGRMIGIFRENLELLEKYDQLIRALGGEKAKTMVMEAIGEGGSEPVAL